jgi:uncharacterized membrane protein
METMEDPAGSHQSESAVQEATRMPPNAHVRLEVAVLLGAATAVLVALFGPWQAAPAAGWGVAAGCYVLWAFVAVWRFDAEDTARFAMQEDPSRAVADVLLLSANVSSLAAVALMLVKAGDSHGVAKTALIGSSVASVIVSWVLVHTIFTLHYASLYYQDPTGGIDFNEASLPCYSDFAYLAFTIGMTFQVSDTNLTTKEIRATALRHALLSFLFGAVIVATTINLIAGLLR